MREATRTVKILVAALLVALAGRIARSQIEIQPRSIDFGERGQNERPEASLTLRNEGPKPVAIREIKKSCDCITISPLQVPIPVPPGGIAQVKVSMGSGRAMGRLDKWITIVTDDPARPEWKVPVAMRVLDEFDMEPREARFDGAVGGPPERLSIDVKTRQGRPQRPFRLEVKGIQGRFGRPSDRHLRAEVSSIPGGQRITIQLEPTHPEGPISAEIEASIDGKGLFIPVNGEMFAWIKVVPNYINFSRALESDPASTVREVTLSSIDGTPFRVLEVSASAQPPRGGKSPARLEFETRPQPDPRAEKAAGAPPPGAASTVQKLVCKAFRGDEGEQVFFGTVTIQTDHPRKPKISLKYSGFFAKPGKK